MASRPPAPRWLPVALVLAGWLLVAAGYWGAWIAPPAAGLRILGLDLAEYVKFMQPVRSGEIKLLREGFYLPLVALSMSLSVLAHRRDLPLPRGLRWLANGLAVPVALSMLPPAWTPPLLTTPEFRLQTMAIAVCGLAALASYPLLRRLPARVAAWVVVLLALAAATLPLWYFSRLLPELAELYHRSRAPVGSAPALMALGFGLLAAGSLRLAYARKA